MEEVKAPWHSRLSVRAALFVTTFGFGLLILTISALIVKLVSLLQIQVAGRYEIYVDRGTEGIRMVGLSEELNGLESLLYYQSSSLVVALILIVSVLLIAVSAVTFYRWKLKPPLTVLAEVSENIRNNNLDFQIISPAADELGRLCDSFEKMRGSLQSTSRELWKSVEERRRLNAAFGHDLRTPVSVLRGYVEMLLDTESEEPPGENAARTLRVMERQILRLDEYLQGMNSVKTLSEILPEPIPVELRSFFAELRVMAGAMWTGRLIFGEPESLPAVALDTQIVVQVFQNMMANAARYAVTRIEVSCQVMEDHFYLTVSDDGPGFPPKALLHATEPYFRAEEDDNTHFGLGLYICKVLCEKCGGRVLLSSPPEGGAMVTAKFFCGISKL